MFKDWLTWFTALTEQEKSDCRVGEQRFINDQAFRTEFMAEFDRIFSTFDMNKDTFLTKAEFI